MVIKITIAQAAISRHLLCFLLVTILSCLVVGFARGDQAHPLSADEVNENIKRKLYEGYLDVDNDKRTSALTDGLQILRYLFGFKGDSLTFGVVPPSAERTDAAEIEEYLDSIIQDLDVDESGSTLPLSDGLMILRYLFGFQYEAIAIDAISDQSTLEAEDIFDRLTSLDLEEEAANTVFVTLKLRYERPIPTCAGGCRLDYEGSLLLPVRYTEVQLLKNGSSEPQSGDTFYTDADGQLVVEVERDTDIAFRFVSRTEMDSNPRSWSVAVRDNQGVDSAGDYPTYAIKTPSIAVQGSDFEVNLDIGSGWSNGSYEEDRASAPFAILDSIIDAMESMSSSTKALTYPHLDIHWSTLNQSGSFYTGSVITLMGDANVDTDEFDHHIVVHEWGHFFSDQMSRDFSVGGPHSLTDLLDPRVAFSEGWANALSGLVIGNDRYIDTSGQGQSSGFSIPLERTYFNSVSGWYSEDSVAQIVFDIFDETSALDDDEIQLSLKDMTVALTEHLPPIAATTTIFSFMKAVEETSPQSSSKLLNLLKSHEIALATDDFDEWGSSETNDASDYTSATGGRTSNALPIHTEMTVGADPVLLCQDAVHGEYNKLANRRFMKMTIEETASYRFYAESTGTGFGRTSPDPDFYIWGTNGTGWAAESDDDYFEEAEIDLELGDYWIELHDWDFNFGYSSVAPCQRFSVERVGD